MHFPSDEEDADFSLGPGGRSRLSNLFPSQTTVEEDPNQALIYTAPKQPKKQQDVQPNSGSGVLQLIHAVAVHTYVLENGKYSSQGKAGAAILGSHEMSEYKLLLYKGKQQKITCCSINSNFNFHIQEKNYANFYDEKRMNWSIMFDSEGNASEFAKQIAIAKTNSCGNNLATVIVQDLSVGEGTTTLEEGGAADVLYTGWIFSNHTFGPVFESNMNSPKPFRFKLGKSQTIKGWSGLAGSKKGTKRLLIIPPALAYGSEGIADKVPPNSVLVFEVLVKKIKEPKNMSHSSSPAKGEGDPSEKPEILPKPLSNDDTIRMRGASISELLTQSPKKVNATIISRMAKMGTATLPLQGSVVAQPSSESEPEEDCFSKGDSPTPPPVAISRSRESSPKPVPKPRTSSVGSTVTHSVQPLPIQGIPHTHINPQTCTQMPIYPKANVNITGVPHQQLMSSTLQMYHHPVATQASFPVVQQPFPSHSLPAMSPSMVSSVADSHLTLLLTETRSQNTEVRLSLSKISDKVETVLQKVEGIRTTHHDGLTGHSSLPYMESSILMQNIQRIVQENSRLKDEAEVKNSKIQSLNEKICDLLQRNQRFFEESNNILEQRSESALSQTKLISLEQEKGKLVLELKETTEKLNALQSELDSCKKVEAEFHEKWQLFNEESKKHKELVDDVSEKAADQEKLLATLRERLSSERQEKRELQQTVQNLQEKISDLESIKESLERSLNDKRKKMEEMKTTTINEMEEIKSSYEQEVRSLIARLKRKPSSDLEQVKELASEGNDHQKFHEELESLRKDKMKLELQLKNLKIQLDASSDATKSHASEEEGPLNDSLWKNKFDKLCESASAQMVKYENHIIELKEIIQQLRNSRSESAAIVPSGEFADQIKRAMNALYRTLQTNLDVSKSYTGSEVLEISLATIRGLTLQLLKRKEKPIKSPKPQEDSQEKNMEGAVQDHQPEGSEEPSPGKVVPSTEGVSIALVEKIPENTVPEPEPLSSSACTETSGNLLNQSNELLDSKSPGFEVPQKDSFENSDSTIETASAEKDVSSHEECALDDTVHSETDEPSAKSEPTGEVSSAIANETERKTPDIWRPPPPPLFDDDDDDDDDDWLK